MTLADIFRMPYGKERRLEILSWIYESEFGRMAVNRKWQFSTKDQDIKKLLKQKKLILMRPAGGLCRQTYLILPPH
jgi:hypothetical protein